MKFFVVDASVGLKWFLPENHSEAAARLHASTYQLHVPGLFDVEIGNILWKKIRRGELQIAEAELMIEQLRNLPINRHTDIPLVRAAFDIAYKTQRTVYDCLYVALAMRLNGELITADERFFNSMTGSPWEKNIRFIANGF